MTVGDGPVERALIKTVVLVVALAIAVAGLSIALIAVQGNKDSVACVNRILATRQDITAKDNAALLDAVNAQSSFVAAINAVITAPSDSAAQAQAYIEFEKVSAAADVTLKGSAATLIADQAYRGAHPLGKC